MREFLIKIEVMAAIEVEDWRDANLHAWVLVDRINSLSCCTSVRLDEIEEIE